MPFSTIKKRPRKASEFKRIYGSKARVLFVKGLPCSACGVVGYSENAHVLGNGGMGRKREATSVAPLCSAHGGYSGFYASQGCHWYFDLYRRTFNAQYPDFNPERAARETEAAWQSHLKESPKNG